MEDILHGYTVVGHCCADLVTELQWRQCEHRDAKNAMAHFEPWHREVGRSSLVDSMSYKPRTQCSCCHTYRAQNAKDAKVKVESTVMLRCAWRNSWVCMPWHGGMHVSHFKESGCSSSRTNKHSIANSPTAPAVISLLSPAVISLYQSPICLFLDGLLTTNFQCR